MSPANEQSGVLALLFVDTSSRAATATAAGSGTRRGGRQRLASPEDRTEVFLSLVDTDFSPRVESDWTLDVMTTCLNPQQLPFGGGQPKFQLDGGGPTAEDCLPDGADQDLPTGAHVRRVVAADLASDSQPPVAGEPRRQCGSASRDSEAVRRGEFEGDAKPDRGLAVGARTAHGRPARRAVSAGVCRGLEVTLHFDEDRFTGSGLYLFGAILERFLGMYSSMNSFTRTVITTNRRDGTLCEWPARAGDMVFL